MIYKLLKKVFFIAAAFSVLLSISCCGGGDEILIDEIPTETTSETAETTSEEMTEETTTEETTEESTTKTLSEEELDELVQNMPEIVFVMSHHYDEVNIKTNILGFYITNTGEMKMYDFRKIAPDEMYEIPDVYDRLEEATCSELILKPNWANSENITENDMIPTSQEELTEYYKKLLSNTEEAEYTKMPAAINMDIGDYRYYGIKDNGNGKKEFIILYGCGTDYEYLGDNLILNELSYWICEKFSNVNLSYND